MEHPGGRGVQDHYLLRHHRAAGVSRIFLDGATSACQQQALCQIMSDFLGSGGCPSWCWTAGRFCATAPCSPAGGRAFWAFLSSAPGPAMPWTSTWSWIWTGAGLPGGAPGGDHLPLRLHLHHLKHVVRALEERGRGWTSPTASWFTAAAGRSWPARRCPRGVQRPGWRRPPAWSGEQLLRHGRADRLHLHGVPPGARLHASLWSDIVVRRGRDYRPCEPGGGGCSRCSPAAPLLSGHSLLTEDLGVLLGRTTALQGKGKYFKGDGAGAPGRGEGCSDTS